MVRLLTPIVNQSGLDEETAHAVRVALGIALARLGMYAPALSYLDDAGGPVPVAVLVPINELVFL